MMESPSITQAGWAVRFAYALTVFLIVSGSVFLLLPHAGDQFLGLADPGADGARTGFIGIRQLQYGLLLAVFLWRRNYAAATIVITLGGLIPLADTVVAFSQTGMMSAMPHLGAAVGAQCLAWMMHQQQKA